MDSQKAFYEYWTKLKTRPSCCNTSPTECLYSSFDAGAKFAATDVSMMFTQLCKDYSGPSGNIYSHDIISAMGEYIKDNYGVIL
jgi:hypothetical protein